MQVSLRRATKRDIPEIERVIRESLIGISSRTYDPTQVKSALEYITRLDPELVDDQTYFVAEVDGAIVACGGWSRRAKLYAGSGSHSNDGQFLDPSRDAARIRAMFVVPQFERRGIGRMILERCERDAHGAGFKRLELMAMLSGLEMYRATGYREVEDVPAKLEDGTDFPLVRMEKS